MPPVPSIAPPLLVGSLIYLTITRPEIAYSRSLDYGLMYQKSEDFLLSGFVDANWVVDVDWASDTNDRHSTSSYCFGIGSAEVSWCSKKQSNVAL
ncbi:secreted RxLR effector protein 161-like [Tripterygium wilfordii]|uniref:secreted RxLR effector protein 161-like n=1 Tax=Tripterygium wilfordii TaxID=458696 RepID=UPI0018F7E6B4|nr:secreted RxLR effector protein 161-like [Tripterygium wilfordii]